MLVEALSSDKVLVAAGFHNAAKVEPGFTDFQLLKISQSLPNQEKIQSKTATKLRLLKVLGVNASLKSISIVFDRFEFASDLGVV